MTLYEIRAAAAAYLGRAQDELIVNSVDLGLIALNQVRLEAELNNNFEFQRNLVTVSVDGVSGGSLDAAVLYGTSTTTMVKSIVDVGLFDQQGNLRAVEWTTVAEGLDRERKENPYYTIRYPTDGQALSGVYGTRRFVFSGSNVYFFPIPTEPIVTPFTLGLEVYTFTTEWTNSDLPGTSEPWTSRGHKFLLWGTIIHLNHLFRQFVPRQEGNLAPPTTLMQEGLDSLVKWDVYKYEQSRRRGR